MTLVKVKPAPAGQTPNGKEKTTDPKELKSQPIVLETVKNDSPLDDRIFKVQKLADLVDKRDKFAASLKKLQSINTSSEGRDVKITIEDAKTDWETSNSEAIRLCVDSLIQTHKDKLAELEQQICW